MSAPFLERYGPWALVAGASEGLGAAFADELASRGLNLLLVARSAAKLTETARDIAARHGVEAVPLALDLGAPALVAQVEEATRGREIGLLVYNAALSPLGPFLDQPLDAHLLAARVNCEGPLALSWLLGRGMRERGRGGIVIVSSLTAFQGSPLLATYGATKAFDLVLAEGLWEELRGAGVDVIAACAGATRTPRYLATDPRSPGILSPPEMEPAAVVLETLQALGRRPSVITGRANRLATFVTRRLLPRRLAVLIMGRATRAMYPHAALPPRAP